MTDHIPPHVPGLTDWHDSKRAYDAWIADLMGNTDGLCPLYGNCAEITLAMGRQFPGLQRVRGHYMCPVWGERAHWWMVDANGNVVDPTADQFPSRGTGEYIPWVEGAQEPTGMCPNCGGAVYDGGTVCSENCYVEFAASIMHGI